MPEPKLSIEELKKLGAPFDTAEVHVSLRAGTARLVLIGFQDEGEPGKIPNVEFPAHPGYSVEQMGEVVVLAAQENGLLHAKSRCVVVDLDALEAGTAKA